MMKPFPEIPQSSQDAIFTVSNTSGISVPIKKELLLTLRNIIEKEEKVRFREIELVFIDDNAITDINKEYLGKDYVTDIITFRLDDHDHNDAIDGTLFCCAQRIEEQSTEYHTGIMSEFYRVFIHGLLHLSGYDDSSKEQQNTMRGREDYYLNQIDILP